MSNLRKFEHILNEGISQEDLANTLCHRIEMRYPDIYKKYDYDAMYNAVDDVASFHAGREELGSSDISMMIRQVFKRLEESEGLAEGYSELDNLQARFEATINRILDRAKAEGRGLDQLTDREKKAIAILKGKDQGVAEEKGTLWRVHQSEATGRYHVVKGYNKDIKMYKNKMGAGDFNSKASAQAKADELNKGVSEDQLDELKCWDGYKRVPGTKAGEPGSCEEIEEGNSNELSTDLLARYKTAAGANARAADKARNFARGNKRFAGIVKATKKQFDNETKPKKESAIMKGIQNETLGTPYPGTYEQEYGPFKRKGQERTMKIAFEGKKNVRR